jgi:hypothetical protein
MITFGPISPPDKDAGRMQVYDICNRFMGSNMYPGRFLVAFEVGEKGTPDEAYHHCHCAIGFINETKVSMKMVNALKALCHVDDQGRKPNNKMHNAPRLTKGEDGAGGASWSILHKYLTTPGKKIKTLDDGALEFIFPERIDHVSTYRRLADKENNPKRRRYYEMQHTLAKLRVEVNHPPFKKKRRTIGEAEAARRVLADQEKKLMLPESWS